MDCDFCASAEATWVYVIAMGFMPSLEGDGFTVPQLDDGRWNACDNCADIADTCDAEALAYHVVSIFHENAMNPTAMTKSGRALLCQLLHDQYAALFDANPRKESL